VPSILRPRHEDVTAGLLWFWMTVFLPKSMLKPKGTASVWRRGLWEVMRTWRLFPWSLWLELVAEHVKALGLIPSTTQNKEWNKRLKSKGELSCPLPSTRWGQSSHVPSRSRECWHLHLELLSLHKYKEQISVPFLQKSNLHLLRSHTCWEHQ
jgi:hypothetical protein